MISENICIVGNRFVAFSDNKIVLTVDNFTRLLLAEEKISSTRCYNIQLGQGIDENTKNALFNLIKQKNLEHRFIFSGINQHIIRATTDMTHKEKKVNALISIPQKIDDYNYTSYLMIDERCAELSDHLTGQHIQGMVVIEAARQMINAVVEKHLLQPNQAGNVSFVLNTLNTTFHHYIFPLEVKLNYQIKKIRLMPTGDLMATAFISVLQNEKKCMEIEIKHSVINKSFLLQKESELATASLKKMMETMNSNHNLHSIAA